MPSEPKDGLAHIRLLLLDEFGCQMLCCPSVATCTISTHIFSDMCIYLGVWLETCTLYADSYLWHVTSKLLNDSSAQVTRDVMGLLELCLVATQILPHSIPMDKTPTPGPSKSRSRRRSKAKIYKRKAANAERRVNKLPPELLLRIFVIGDEEQRARGVKVPYYGFQDLIVVSYTS